MEVLQSGPVLEPWMARAVNVALIGHGQGYEPGLDLQHDTLKHEDESLNNNQRRFIREAKDCFVWKGMERDGVA